ncbi:protein of unknown function [Cupriavidus taiwanensis]|uniref:Uncharacterized protein n=1 Tax=Cupriavidus taiwanensis TaxID=164546 RepID=A0A375IFN9_9BURK|nr:hypothetical protein CBM2623_A60081 [Cupriavidus taiwanensis]SPK73596.1 protein of unknown function [Cupriavidus taiwanensis]
MGWQVCEKSGTSSARDVRIASYRSARYGSLVPRRAARLCRGVAKLVKAPDFDSGIRRFESFFPCHYFL